MIRLSKHLKPLLVLLLVSTLLLPNRAVVAQGPPPTDIYVVSVTSNNGVLDFGTPTNATDRDGYDNQPSFVPDGGAILYTSNRGDQTEICEYNISTGAIRIVAATHPESEYSPTVTPAGRTYSVIRVEADSTQRLWQFDLDGTNPTIVLENIMPVGYHAWGDDHTLGIFVLGSPATFQIADTRTGEGEVIASSVGRSIHKIPGRHAISFTHRTPELWIKEIDLDSKEVTPIVELLESEFYAWMPDGTILTGSDSKLLRWSANDEAGWQEVADFASYGINGISRLAVSPAGNMLAIVATR